MDIVAIEDAIKELETSDTTADNVSELASLYIVYENMKDVIKPMVKKEYDDILPAYRKYCESKRKYQMKEVSEGVVIKDLKLLCTEIEEFLHIIYVGTDMNRERNMLINMVKNLENTYNTTF